MKGFTLIEIIVAVGVFAVIVTLATSIFANFTNTQRRASTQQETLESLRIALEVINRDVRTSFGDTFFVNIDGTLINFRNGNNFCIQYSLVGNQLARQEVLVTSDTTCDQVAYDSVGTQYLTEAEANITTLAFTPVAATVEQPALLNQGYLTTVVGTPVLDMQTTVATRQVNPWQIDIGL